jgi:hypothetical protein
VDLNPLAVELCKVALWLEAHNPGEPLNFLDHHIKCGNAIVGFARREEARARRARRSLQNPAGRRQGHRCRLLRKRNKEERRSRGRPDYRSRPACKNSSTTSCAAGTN